MLESNPPGIVNWKLIDTMSRERQSLLSLPLQQPLIGSIDFPMPKKTHACVALNFLSSRTRCSNSIGERYPNAECKRF